MSGDTIGATALYLLFLWLLSAIIAGWLAHRKGFTERIGLATGMLLPIVGPLVWIFWPPKPDSPWKREGPFPKRSR